jgi:hypothetical protein
MKNPTTEKDAAGDLRSSGLLECILRWEHGWITIRNQSGWLLWSAKAMEADCHQGILLADIAPKIEARQAEWERDQDETAEHSNDKLSEPPTQNL